MNFKKFISGISALTIAASAFAAMAVTASAAAGDSVDGTRLYIGGANNTNVVSEWVVGEAADNANITLMVDDNSFKFPTNRVSTSQTNNTGLITLASAYDISGETNKAVDGHANDIKITWTSYYTGNTYGSNGQRRLEFLDSNGVQVLPSVINYNWANLYFNYTNSATTPIGSTSTAGTACEIDIKTNSSGDRIATLKIGDTVSETYEVKGNNIAQIRLWVGNVNDSNRVLYVKDLTFEAVEPAVDVTYYPVLVKSSVGDVKFVDQEAVEEGTTINYTFPKYLTDANNNVIAYSNASSFKGSVSANANSGNVEVPYVAYDGVAIEIEPTTNNFVSDADKLSNADSYRAFNKNNIGSITIPEDGEYQISANIFSNNVNNTRRFAASVGETALIDESVTWSINAVRVVTSEKTMLKEGDVINFTAGDTQLAVDYILVEKTGDYVAPAAAFDVSMGDGTVANGDDGVATWYIATVTNTGNAEGSFGSMRLYKNEVAAKAAQSFTTSITLDPSANVYIGVIINGLDTTSDAVTATVE